MLETRPYTGVGDAALPDNVKALPDHAKAIWVAAFNSAYKSWSADKTDQTQDAYGFAVAWAAVNKLYRKDADGQWVKRSLTYEGAGHFTKVWRAADGSRHWRATIMDDGVDAYATRMTIEFQDDICARANAGIAAGGPLPVWLGIAHYGKRSQIGEVTRLYRDGRMVKAEGTFLTDAPTPLQAGLVEAAYQAAFKESSLLPAHRAICTSQAFYPEAHAVEDCGVLAYTRGRIDHIALTTRPGNSRADFGVEQEGDMSRSSKNRRQLRREDAAAIVGDDLAGQLDAINRNASERSVEDDGLLYRTSEDGDDIEVSPDGGDTWQVAEPVLARAMVPTHKPALNDPATAWDAGAARKRIWEWATGADGTFDPKKARQGFAIFDSENPDNKTAMVLPHHDIESEKMVTQQRGVYAAGGVVMGAHGGFTEFQGGDTDHAKTHLAVHYGQMDKTPPWQRQESNLRHWAEAMEEIEIMAAAGQATEQDVANARAFLRFRLGDGTITRPTVVEAVAMFAGATEVGAALLRATAEEDFGAAIRSVVIDPDSVGTAAAPAPGQDPPEGRVGRRVKGEKLAAVTQATGQFGEALKAIKDFITWAGENIPAEADGTAGRAEHRVLMPDSDYMAELTDRMGAEPDDSVIGAMNEHAMLEAAYQAGYTFLDIVVANVTADPAELGLEDRLRNVQSALNEFGQIISHIISQAAQAPTRTDGGGSNGAATGAGVKPDGEGRAPVKPSTRGPAPDALAAVTDVLTEIAAAAVRGAEAGELQLLLDRLAVGLDGCITRDGTPPGLAEALAPYLERLQVVEDELRARQQPDDRAAPGAPPAAPPRRKGYLPRLDMPMLEARQIERPTEEGWTPRQIVEGAHRRSREGFNPYG